MKYALQQTLISSPGLLSNCCCVTITAAGSKYESHGGKIFLREIRARSAGLIAPKTLLPLWEMETNEFFISQPFPSISCHDLFFFSASVLWFMSLFLSWKIKAKDLATQMICSESALIMRVVFLWWIQSHVYGNGTGAVPRWIFNCKTEAGFRFQDHLQHPSVADRPKKGRAQLKRSIFCLFVKQTLYTEYGHPLPW